MLQELYLNKINQEVVGVVLIGMSITLFLDTAGIEAIVLSTLTSISLVRLSEHLKEELKLQFEKLNLTAVSVIASASSIGLNRVIAASKAVKEHYYRTDDAGVFTNPNDIDYMPTMESQTADHSELIKMLIVGGLIGFNLGLSLSPRAEKRNTNQFNPNFGQTFFSHILTAGISTMGSIPVAMPLN